LRHGAALGNEGDAAAAAVLAEEIEGRLGVGLGPVSRSAASGGARACLVDLAPGTGGITADTTGTLVLTCPSWDSVRVALCGIDSLESHSHGISQASASGGREAQATRQHQQLLRIRPSCRA
jgi:hypothetical protein